MSTRIKILLLFLFITFLKSNAQKPGDTKVLSDNSSFKGRVELWNEKKVRRHERKLDKRNARKARKKNTAVSIVKSEPKRKKRGREKHKAKPVTAPAATITEDK
ncbi:MAG: hypothetical protein ACXVPN_12055 [Bacteroidia bacterium]